MSRRSIIFLDCDGVINHWPDGWHRREGVQRHCPDCVERVNRLVELTGARIVVSSTWRLFKCWLDDLRLVGLNVAAVTDKTRELVKKAESGLVIAESRGKEIADWLERNEGSFDRFVILDDDTTILPEHQAFHVQTRVDAGGFTEDHLRQALHVLGGGSGEVESG